MKLKRLVLTCLITTFFILSACSNQGEKVKEEPTPPTPAPIVQDSTPAPPVKEDPPKKEVSTVTLHAIGDVLIHEVVYKDAKTKSGYDFKPMFASIKHYMEQSDISMANQESMIGGEEIGLSTYPSFNSPQEVGDALKDMGVDIVTISNNHTLDRGEKAIRSALAHWNELAIPYTGAFASKEDQETLRVLNKNGISIGFLSYTYGTNGIPVPKGKDYLVNLIDVDKITAEVKLAKEKTDAVVVSLHFGNEYERKPNAYQQEVAKAVAEAGADVIIGHHPHVLQPPAWIEGKNGHKTFVMYSLGNFISGQKGDYKDIGGIVGLTFEKTVEGDKKSVEVKNPNFLLTFSGKDANGHYRVVPLHEKNSTKFNEMKKHMTSALPELNVQ